ncbi:hypothetical protein N177_1692 [Lutibaculum baratangense AMV1]|uniref:Uncharacterized protein n=1 Tax=Lutibaculum baratangense AMV1 TaxID=631454 RepID=V4RR05_9HYPH|nr:hypothetical protein N177_1692 [Lutibaculum baratangense AMV1]
MLMNRITKFRWIVGAHPDIVRASEDGRGPKRTESEMRRGATTAFDAAHLPAAALAMLPRPRLPRA